MNSKYNIEKNKDLDQGWAWVIMVAACIAGIITGILLYGAGVIHVALLQRFEEDNAYTALIGSIYTSLLSVTGPFASMLINFFNCRITMIVGGMALFIGFVSSFFVCHNLNYILITYGIIAGMGLGFVATPPFVVIGYFFHKKRGLALAVVASGAGIGMFVAGPLIQALLNQYGLSGAFLVLGALASNHIVIGILIRPSALENKHKKYLNRKRNMDMLTSHSYNNLTYTFKNILHLDILSNKAFMFCSFQYLLWNIPFSILLLHFANNAVLQGSTKENAALLITYIGISSVFGRILTGLSIGHNGLDPVMLNFGFTGIIGLLTLLFPLYSGTFQGQTIFALVFGLYAGGLSTMINPLCMELIGVSNVSSGVGTMLFICGVGCIKGPPVAGFILDHGGTYENSFVLCAVFTLISSNWRSHSTDVVGEEVFCSNHEDQSHNMCNVEKIQTNVCPHKDLIDENDHLITEV